MQTGVTSGERKLATLLFADLSGYTDLTRRLDPEDVVSVVDPVMRDLQHIAEKHGGTVLLVAGDGLLVAFGVPFAKEDDCVRSLRAAVEMRSRTERVDSRQGLHAGIASGEVLITPDPHPRGWTITGLCIALATRLADRAANGVILVDTESRRLAGTAPEWGDSHEVELHGMGPEPLNVHELHTADRPAQPRPSRPFVDRVHETTRLDEVLDAVRTDRRSRLVALEGDAGLGKSRLLEAWTARHPEVPTIWLRCRSYGVDQPLAGLLDALVEHLRENGLLNIDALSSLLDVEAPEEAGATARRVLGHAGLLEGPAASPDLGEILASATRQLIAGISRQTPLVIVIDDVHWAGEDVKVLLAGISREPLSGAALIVVLQREGEAWTGVRSLDSLPAWAAEELIAHRAGKPSSELLEHLLLRTGGNPFYLEECVSLLADTGALVARDGVCDVTDAAALEGLPPSIRAVLAARLDALPSSAKEVALIASVSADFIPSETVMALAEDKSAGEGLAILVDRGILKEELGGFRFRHRLLQEVAYAALTRARRVRLHQRSLELLAPEALSLRAFHAEAAWEQQSAESAERSAVALSALRELRLLAEMVFTWQADGAHEIFVRAERMLGDVREDACGEVPLLLAAHAQTLVELGRPPEAVDTARRAVELCLDGFTPRRVEAVARLALGRALARAGDIAASRTALERVLELSRSLADRGLRGRALWAMADAWRFDSSARFKELLEAAHEELVAAGDQWAQAQVARLLAYTLSMSGGEQFRRWYGEVLRCQSLDDLRGRAMMARIKGFEASGRAAWAEALMAADEARDIGARGGLMDVVTDGRFVAMQAHTMLGDSTAVLLHREAMLASEEQLSVRSRQALACASVLAVLRGGEAGAAVDLLRQGSALLGQLGDRELLLQRQATAELALDSGLWTNARIEGDIAQELANSYELHLMSIQLGLLVGRASLALGDRAQNLVPALEVARSAGAEALVDLASVLLEQDGLGERVSAVTVGLPKDDNIEARAIWFENAAMRATDDDEARENWQRAHDEWSRLGHTIWPIRAAKAKDVLPRNARELAQIPLTPLLDDLTSSPSDG